MPDPEEPRNHALSEAEVRAQLHTICTSEFFSSAARSRRFLEFVVEQTLAGKQDTIKESVLGAEVFDRPHDYDPRADGIVRVEATKLRARLADYYAGPGKDDALVIDVPKGSYVPRFTSRAKPPALRAPVRRKRIFIAAGAAAVLAAVAWFAAQRLRPGAEPFEETPAIAVLPFLNLSSDPENEYFSDGLTEQLTDVLTQAEGLRVASRTSAFAFKGKAADAREIGAKLHVTTLVEGSVRKSGSQLRITAQLIRVRDGYHLWSKTFERPLDDVFELQDEISRQIAHTLQVTLAEDVKRRWFSRYTKNLDAFDLYLRGRYLVGTFRPGDSERARSLFEQALALDPRFAMAYVGIANVARQNSIEDSAPPAEVANSMKSAAQKALEIDPNLAEAQAMLADAIARFDWDWPRAEREFRRAIELNPRSPDAHWSYGLDVLLPQRRYADALSECGKAIELDPVSSEWALCKPWVLVFQNPDLAIAEYKRLLASEPENAAFKTALGIAYMHAGSYAEAIEIFERDPGLGNVAITATLAYLYGRAGRNSDAAQMTRRLGSGSQYVSPFFMAFAYLGVGEVQQARRAAQQYIQERGSNTIYMAMAPIFEPLRSDPETMRTLKAAGIPF